MPSTLGTIETCMIHNILIDKRFSGPIVAEIPLGRAGRPADITRVACFLALDEASFSIGQLVGVNGSTYR